MASIDNKTLSAINTSAATGVSSTTSSNVVEPGLSPNSATTADGGPISPIGNEEKERLAKLLAARADAKELQEKNILKKSNLAPSLQAAQAELAKHQLEDRLEGRLERRPDRDDLVARGILKDQTVAPALQASRAELEKAQLEDKIGKEFASRPDVEQLRAAGILRDEEAAATAAATKQ